jgi:O-antigen/teichoic acid export membrane protein
MRFGAVLKKNMHFFRAAGLMAATSVLVPVVGVATAPILAHGLGVAGRGTVAAALAPNVLLAGAATLGLPDALTYFLAKAPGRTRAALRVTSLLSVLVGAVAFVVVALFAAPLSGGVRGLDQLIVLATAFAVPLLLVNLLRGAAIGRHMWTAVAAERVTNSFLRLIALALLLILNQLTVLNAVLVMAIGPLVAGAAYWRIFRRPAEDETEQETEQEQQEPGGARDLIRYGTRMWLGSVASIVISRLGPLLVTPLSDVRQLGLLTAAVAIADVPFIVATSVRDVLFGADSRQRDAQRLALLTRASTGVALLGSIVLGVSLPFWIEIAFGRGFAAAMPATWILLASVVVNVPGWMAGSGLSAWGRPELRSAGLVASLLANLVVLLLLVPPLGATGAAIAALVGALTLTGFTLVASASIVGVRYRDLLLPRPDDLRAVVRTARAAIESRRARRRDRT